MYALYKYSFTIDAFPTRAAVITRTLTYSSYSRWTPSYIRILLVHDRLYTTFSKSNNHIISLVESVFVWACCKYVFFSTKIGFDSIEMNIDSVLVTVGMGRYQFAGCVLFGLMLMYSDVSPVAYVFTAGDLKYR